MLFVYTFTPFKYNLLIILFTFNICFFKKKG